MEWYLRLTSDLYSGMHHVALSICISHFPLICHPTGAIPASRLEVCSKHFFFKKEAFVYFFSICITGNKTQESKNKSPSHKQLSSMCPSRSCKHAHTWVIEIIQYAPCPPHIVNIHQLKTPWYTRILITKNTPCHLRLPSKQQGSGPAPLPVLSPPGDMCIHLSCFCGILTISLPKWF